MEQEHSTHPLYPGGTPVRPGAHPSSKNQPSLPRVWRKQRPYHLIYPFPSCTLPSSSSYSYTRKTNNQISFKCSDSGSQVGHLPVELLSHWLPLTLEAAHREKDYVRLDYGTLCYKVSVSKQVLWTIFKNPGPHSDEYSGNSAFLVGFAMFLRILECLNYQKTFLMPPPLLQPWPNLIIQGSQ